MLEYRISYYTNGAGEEACNIFRQHEFSAVDDDKAAEKYEEFKKEKEMICRGEHSSRYNFLGLERIDQREVTTDII